MIRKVSLTQKPVCKAGQGSFVTLLALATYVLKTKQKQKQKHLKGLISPLLGINIYLKMGCCYMNHNLGSLILDSLNKNCAN